MKNDYFAFRFFKCLLIPYVQAYHNYCLIIQSNFATVHPKETWVALFSANGEIQNHNLAISPTTITVSIFQNNFTPLKEICYCFPSSIQPIYVRTSECNVLQMLQPTGIMLRKDSSCSL
ncbi:hypothetical protein E2542_SST06386 [Spatholobus suberectus]|nr:hypothetical protein E2542_SST06386 [Spatholobus suberectus]